MNVKDIIETEILSNGMNGEGVARTDGKVVFVPYTLKGERVRATIRQIKKNYITASVIKVLSPSKHRVTPSCPHYYKCGGCDMGHISEEYRREILIAELQNNLKKIARLDIAPSEFIACDGSQSVRNKLSMPFGMENGKVVLGLYKQDTHVVVQVECGMSGKLAKEIARIVTDFANAKKLSVYNSDTGKGLLRHLIVREIEGRASATLVINAKKFDGEKELSWMMPDGVDFFVCPNEKHNNVIMGETVRLVKGKPHIDVEVSGVKAELGPLSFFQVNDVIRDKLYESAIGCIRSDTLVDLYSGIGITSNLAAKKCNKVIAVECVPQAVDDADVTAALNGNEDKIKNICGKVQEVLSDIKIEAGQCDVLVDPPRKGCGREVMQAISRLQPQNLIYISCNHATMCRDIRDFLDVRPDYVPTVCKVFDMFPATHHTETLVVLSKR